MRKTTTVGLAIIFGVSLIAHADSALHSRQADTVIAKHGVPEDKPKPEKPQRPEKPGRMATTVIAKHGVPEDNPKPEKPERPGDDHPKPGHVARA